MKNDKRIYVIARCKGAGVHAGYLESRGPDWVVLSKARRLWKWFGGSLSELARYGSPDPSRCQFGAEVTVELDRSDVCELIHCTPAGMRQISEQPEWRA
jgi:hypothetical protein